MPGSRLTSESDGRGGADDNAEFVDIDIANASSSRRLGWRERETLATAHVRDGDVVAGIGRGGGGSYMYI